MTPLLQFLDVHINKPFKDQPKDQYEVWVDEGKKEYTASGYGEIVEWINTTWKVVATDEMNSLEKKLSTKMIAVVKMKATMRWN